MAVDQTVRTTDPRQVTGSVTGVIPGTLQSTAVPGGGATPVPRPTPAPAPSAPVTDPNALPSTITPENTLRGQRLGFDVNAGAGAGGASGFERVNARNTQGSIGKAFAAQLPALNLDFERNVEQLAARTAALGRTGSGLFNRETGYIGDDARTARESLLGNLVFQATQNDANRALQAATSNQGAGLSIAGLNSSAAIAGATRQMQADLARQAHLQYLQTREDQLARESMADKQTAAALQALGFSYSPTGAIGNYAQTALTGAGMYGANAGQINNQLGSAASGAVQAWSPPTPGPSVVPGQRPPVATLPVPATNMQPFTWDGPKPNRPDISQAELGF